MASDFLWNNPYWDAAGILDNNGSPKIPTAYYQSESKQIDLENSSNRFVIGKSDITPQLPSGIEFVRNITANVAVYESQEPLTPALIASIGELPGVAYTAPVYINQLTQSEAVLLNEVLVALKPGETAENYFGRSNQFASYRPLDGTPDQFVATVKSGYGRAALETANQSSVDPAVKWVTPNFYQNWQKQFSPNDPRLANQWTFNNFGQGGGLVDADSDVDLAWDIIPGGSSGMVIGIVDDGVESSHADLDVWTNPGETNFDGIDNDGNGWVDDIHGWNFVFNTNQSEPVGNDMHGTSVAGVAAAKGDNAVGVAGVAYHSQVMSLKIFDNGFVASDADIAGALYYAAGRTRDGLGTWKSADLVNNSWGGGGSSAAINAALAWGTTQGREGAGAAYFFATGNDFATTISEPAVQSLSIPGVIAVGATNNQGTRSDYSNYGAGLDFVTPSNDTRPGYLAVDTTDRVGASGYAAGDYTGTGITGFGGTSSASPLATGIGALVLAQAQAKGMNLSPTELRSLLRNATDLIGGASYDVLSSTNVEFGYGRLNALTAVSGVDKPELSIVTATTELDTFSTVGFTPAAPGLFSETTLRIRNQGTRPLDLNSVSVTGPFSVQSLGANVLNIGESTTLTLRFTPPAAGSFFGTARVNTNDADESAFEFTLFGTAAATSIAGTVFEDYDGDGAFESFERYLSEPNTYAYLDTNDDGFWNVGETRVNIANGGFAFEGLGAGTYIVRTEVPNWTRTFPDKNRYLVTLSSGTDSKTGFDFGYSKNNRLYSYVYEEINRNGIIDPNEPPLEGFTVSGVHDYAVSNSVSVPIPSRGTISSTINVPLPGTVVRVDVLVNIDHTWDSDLTLTLTAPDGTTILLAQAVGGSGDNFTNTKFSDLAATSINSGTVPFTGTFRPQQALSQLNGMPITGNWTLTVNDSKDFDSGLLRNWSLEFRRRFFGVSDVNGWALVDVPGGTHTVGIELQPDWLYSNPLSGNYVVSAISLPIYNRPFGIFYDNVSPTDLILSNNTVDENLPVDTLVGDFTSIDPNRTGNVFTYTLVPGVRPNDNVQFRLVGNQLLTSAVFNHEAKDTYLIRVRTTDALGEFYEEEFNIFINNLQDPSAEISGVVFEDYNGNGVFESFERPVSDANAFAYIDDNDNGIWEVTERRVSLTNGSFVLAGLAQGSFVVRSEAPGWTATSPIKNRHFVVLPSDSSIVTGIEFGRSKNDRYYSFVYEEIDQDNTLDPGEPALPGFTVSGVHTITASATPSMRIPATGTLGTVSSTIDVATTGMIMGLEVVVDITHTWDDDLTLTLTGPGGQIIVLAQAVGGNADNFTNTRFSDSAVTPIASGTAPFTGTFRPVDALSVFNGTDLQGTWTLTIEDNKAFDIGRLNRWSLEFQRKFSTVSDANGWALMDLPPLQTNSIAVELQTDWLFSRPATGSYLVTANGTPKYNFFYGLFFDNVPPTGLNLSNLSVPENQPISTLVGTFSSIDPNRFGNTFTYTFVGTGNDNASFTIVGSSLRTAEIFNFEVKNSYSIRVRTTDAGGEFFEQDFVISITDANDAPANLALTPTTVDENAVVGTIVGLLTSTDEDPGDVHTYSLVAGAGSFDNGSFTIVGDTLQTAASFDFETQNSFSIRVRAQDILGAFVDRIFNIDVQDINEPASLINLSNNTIAENTGVGFPVGLFSNNDPDAGDSFTYSLVAGAGDSGNAGFQIVGNELQTAIDHDRETQNAFPIRVRVTDLAGLVFDANFVINITNINEGPTSISLSPAVLNENEPIGYQVGTLSNNDPDLGDTIIYELVDGATANDNLLFRINGDKLETTVTLDFEARSIYTIEVRAVDRLGLSTQTVIAINVQDVNEKPYDISVTPNEIFENIAIGSLVGMMSAKDHDFGDTYTLAMVSGAGDTDNAKFQMVGNELRTNSNLNFETQRFYSIRVRATDAAGLVFEMAVPINVLNVNENPTGISLAPAIVNENLPAGTEVGTLTTLDPDLADAFTYELVSNPLFPDNAQFVIVGDKLQTASVFNYDLKTSYSISVRSIDQGGLSVTRSLAVTVANVNDPPTNINLSTTSIPENLALNSVVGTFSTVDFDAVDSHTYTLVNGAGALDNAAFTIVGNQLKVAASVDFETKSVYSIRVESRDAGGLTFQKVFTISVTNVNESPTAINSSSVLILENAAVGSLVGLLSTQDPDQPDSFVYSLAAGAGATDNSKFRINGNRLESNAIFDFEAVPSYSIRVRTTDALGLSFESVFAISVLNANETPFGLNVFSNIVENSPLNSDVGVASASDPDAGDQLVYALVSGQGGQDNASFTIATNGLIRNLSPIDFESKPTYNIRVRATDKGGLTVEQAFVLSVVNTNEAPTQITTTGVGVDENLPSGSVVGALNTADPDAGDTFTYSFISGAGGADNSSFAIVGNELRTASSFNFEAKSQYFIRVLSTDAGGLTVEQQLTIGVRDVNEAPSALAISNVGISENLPAASLVGLLSTTDVDAGEQFVYSLVSGAGSDDNASFSIVNNRLETKAPFDFETKNSYLVRVRSTDRGGLTTELPLVVQVQDVNDVPTNLAISSQSVNENSSNGTLIGLLSASDQDLTDTVTYRFVSGINDNAFFTLQGAARNELRLNTSVNFESKSSYTVVVQAIDQSLTGPTRSLVISVNDLNDPVTNVLLSSSVIDENAALGTIVGKLTSTDEDLVGVHSYTLVSGTGATDNASFAIVGDELRSAAIFDFEVSSTKTIRVRGTDAGGSYFEKVFPITVRNLAEAPTGLALSKNRINENLPANSLVGLLSASDSDVGDAITYSLVTGTGSDDNAAFSIFGSQLLAKNGFDFETDSSYTVRVRATDSTARSVESVFSISVDNVNEVPSGIVLSSNSVAENRPVGTSLALLSTTDSDLGETYTYSFIPTAVFGDNVNFEIVGNELRSKIKFNYEVRSTYQVSIRSTDSSGLSVDVPLTFNVTDVNELPPVAVADSAKTTTDSIVIINVLGNDTDADSTIDVSTVRIVTPPSQGSVRVLTDGRIEFTPPVNLRATSTFSYSVKDSDGVSSNSAVVSILAYSAFQNQRMALDVDADGSITPLDVLTIVNDINTRGLRVLPTGVPETAPYLDTNGNGQTDPLDALAVINHLNTLAGGEGERSAKSVDQVWSDPTLLSDSRKKESSSELSASMLSIDDYFRDLEQGRKRRS